MNRRRFLKNLIGPLAVAIAAPLLLSKPKPRYVSLLGSVPAGIINIDRELSDADIARLQQQFYEALNRHTNAHDIRVFTTPPLVWVPLRG